MNLEGNGPEIPGGEITKLVTAVTQMAGQLRQIKILVLIYAVATVLERSCREEYDHEPRSSDDQAESVGPSENAINLSRCKRQGVTWSLSARQLFRHDFRIRS